MWQGKLNSWFYRRFIGDRKAEGARCGRKQKILDVPRAKWNTYEAMEGYFHSYVQTLVEEGIAYYNDECAALLCAAALL